ncbi:Ctr copper transporter family-domain-containing protein [Penicillium argentinense]|uniref:Copper transport protein n=1 Tax=Penicillium argentinense TaxID=1131581 RepID=A0A9W9JY60_9EURO|nr:Ctr copper transporter family-domain-containing protein [Penicillium argentinense]KAJ5085918.1 Ctr copper transporter family-domain-containing protein [Penicillium argentinense]
MHDMDMGSSSSSECKISMLFNWYTIDACFLSEGWHIQNNGMFAATCIGTILLVVLVEFFRRAGKEYDNLLTRQFERQAAARKTALAGDWLDCAGGKHARRALRFRVTPLQQLARAFLHALTFGGAYIIMLLAMYFNVYVIICIFIGAGLGKFLCDWMVVQIDLDLDQDETHEGAKGVEETTVCCG